MQEFMMDKRDNQHSLGHLRDVDTIPKAHQVDNYQLTCRRCHKRGHYVKNFTSQPKDGDRGNEKGRMHGVAGMNLMQDNINPLRDTEHHRTQLKQI